MSPLRKCIVCGRDLGPPLSRGRPTTVCSAKCSYDRKNIQRTASRHRAAKRGCPPDKHGTATGYTQYECKCDLCKKWARTYKSVQRSKQKEVSTMHKQAHQ